MPVSMKIEGIDSILLKLKQRQAVARKANGSASVVYEAPYAVFVHERMDLHHPVGQAKFLEQPAREYRRRIGGMIAAEVKGGTPVPEAIIHGAEFLMARSQALCPVATGFLRDSAHVVADFAGYPGGDPRQARRYSKRVVKTAFRNLRRR